jgi:hypothetical protein
MLYHNDDILYHYISLISYYFFFLPFIGSMGNPFIGAPFMYYVINLALYSLTPRSIRRSYKSLVDLVFRATRFGAVAGVLFPIPVTSWSGSFY